MPNSGKDAWEEHLKTRITDDTVFFDHDLICEMSTMFPHALPPKEVFTEWMKRLRVPVNADIICYDGPGMFSVARVAWLFRFFGAQRVRILNGGLTKWMAEGKPVVAVP